MPPSRLAADLLLARDRERRELSRTLHTNAAQQLAALQFHLDLLLQSAGALPANAAEALDSCASLASACALEIRRICYALYPPLLDEIGLAQALRSRADLQKIDADIPESLPRLAPDTEIALFRIIEEALPQITKLRLAKNRTSLTVELDLASPSAAIRERVRGFQGKIAAGPGSTRITVPLKLEPQNPD